MSGRRSLLVIAGVAAVSLVAGLVAGRSVRSPAQVAAEAEPPERSPVTVAVERRELTSRVVTRGDAVFAGAVDVQVETGALQTPPVVTGQIPDVGATITEGTPILEVAGRPVIALGGQLPTYRALRPGMSGPDVAQLEAALVRLGIDTGDESDETYDAATADGVAALFEQAGYEPPEVPEELTQELRAARQAARAAEDALGSAEQALQAASAGADETQVLQAESRVNDAKRAVRQARRQDDGAALAAAKDQLKIARAQLRELRQPPDTDAEEAAVDRAEQELARARERVAELQAEAGTPVPAAEVVFVPGLPRRVDAVHVTRGSLIEGAVMTVSGADLVVTASLSDTDRELVEEGMAAQLSSGESSFSGTITGIRRTGSQSGGGGSESGGNGSTGNGSNGGGSDGQGGSGAGSGSDGAEAVVTPDELTDEQVSQLRGANLRVTIPVAATDGKALVVPLAAVTTGADGTSQIELRADDGTTRQVSVEVGLSAEGDVEIVPAEEGAVSAGDRVVVGR